MLSAVKSFFVYLLRIGVNHAKSFTDAKRVILTNAICYLFIALGMPYSIFFIWVNLTSLGILTAFIVSFFSYTVYLNYKGNQPLAGFALIIIIASAVYSYASILGPDCGIQYMLFALMAIPAVVFNNKQRLLCYSCMVFTALLYVGAEFFNYPFFYHSYLTTKQYWIIRLGLTIDTLLIIFFTVYFHLDISSHLNKTLSYFLQLNQLTARESEVAVKAVLGLASKDISSTLFIEESTVKTHLKNVYRKLNVKNRSQLVELLSR